MLSAKKVLYAVFFSGEGVAVQVPVKKGKSVIGKYYKDVILKKLKKDTIRNGWRPVMSFKHVQLLHDNAPAHTSALLQIFCKKRR